MTWKATAMAKKNISSPRYFTLKPFHRPLSSAFYEVRKILNPHWFQGNRQYRQYFEGWYFKNVSAQGQHCWSFIPGISLVENDTHAFVQAINGQTGQTYYFRFPAQQFLFSGSGFNVSIGKNYFSTTNIILDLEDEENQIRGELHYDNITSYPVHLARPGIMGWYRYVPFMECYHGVVSFDHAIRGAVSINGESLDFEGGRGYTEKDWGSSMPKAWIWMQSNHFEENGTSFMLSVARIPWIGETFTGFLGFFLHQGHLINFATYTGAQITDLSYTEKDVHLRIEGKKYILQIHGVKASGAGGARNRGSLKAPVLGNMERIIHENINAQIHLQVHDKAGNLIFEGTGQHSGLEFVGDLELLNS